MILDWKEAFEQSRLVLVLCFLYFGMPCLGIFEMLLPLENWTLDPTYLLSLDLSLLMSRSLSLSEASLMKSLDKLCMCVMLLIESLSLEKSLELSLLILCLYALLLFVGIYLSFISFSLFLRSNISTEPSLLTSWDLDSNDK